MVNNQTKICTRCNEEKPLDQFNNYEKVNKKGEKYIYYNSQCKECIKLKDKLYYEKNKEKILKQKKEYYESNNEKIKLEQEKYRKVNVEKKRQYDKIYRKENAEIMKIKLKKFRQENQERVKEQRKNNPKIKEYEKRYRQEKAEQIKAQQKKYYQSERGRESIFKKSMKRRSYKQKVQFTPMERKEILERDNWTCQCCGIKVHDRSTGDWNTPDKAHIDHIVPISKGGSSVPNNLQVLCRTCNTSKRNSINKVE